MIKIKNKNFHKKNKNNFLQLFLFFLLFIFLFFNITNARPSDKLKGYAWSDGAGWISFNCTNTASCDTVEYGVTTDANGNLSGFAWSDKTGWLSFNLADMQGMSDVSQPKIDMNTGIITGTALFVDGLLKNDDGWSGLVALSKLPSWNQTNYESKLNLTSYELEGWAWGGKNSGVGWISFNCLNTNSCATTNYQVTYDPFYFHFTANQGLNLYDPVPSGGSVVLSWTTSGASSCTASNGAGTDWTTSPSGTSKVVGEPNTANQTISNLNNNTLFTLACQDNSGINLTRNLNIMVAPPAPQVSLTAAETNIPSGSSTNLTWTTANVASCEASGDWSGAKNPAGGTEPTGPLTNRTNLFHISCLSNNSSYYPTPVNDSVYVFVDKLTVELNATKIFIPYFEKIELRYRTEFADSCTATGTVPGWAGTTIDLSPGEHIFTTADPITAENQTYTATLSCSRNDGQNEEKTVEVYTRKNPNYQEI